MRDQQKATHITKEYPNVRIVSGSLEDGDLIADEASKADIVLSKHKDRSWPNCLPSAKDDQTWRLQVIYRA